MMIVGDRSLREAVIMSSDALGFRPSSQVVESTPTMARRVLHQ